MTTCASDRTISELIGQAARTISRVSGGAAVLALLVAVTWEVFSRSVLDRPTTWVTEYSGYAMVAITFLGAAYAQARDSHVRVTLLLDKFSIPRRRIAEQVAVWAAILVVMVLAWKSAGFVHAEYLSGTRDWGLMATPLWVPQSLVVLGFSALLVTLVTEARHRADEPSTTHAWTGGLLLTAVMLLLYADAFGLSGPPLKPDWGLGAAGVAVLIASMLWSGTRVTITLSILAAIPAFAYWLTASAALPAQGLVLVLTLVYLLLAGVRIAFALGFLALLGIVFWLPSPILRVMAERSWTAAHHFELAAIPMFVLMGSILVRSEITGGMFLAMRALFGRMRGGFCFASIGAAGLFSAVCGSSLATAATLGQVAGGEMIDHGYNRRLTYGVLAAGGTLGILLPPSIAMIVYGSLAGVPVTRLFIAGVIPGLVMMALFALVVFGWLLIRRSDAPTAHAYSYREKARHMLGVMPFVALMLSVLGTLYAGIATPTEAGALGAVAALLLAALYGKLTWKLLVESIEESLLVTSFLLLIAVGAAQMTYVMDFLGMAASLVDSIRGFDISGGVLLTCIALAYLVLGMFVEPISMVLMTMPVVLPLITAVGWDPLWFGVVLVVLIEIGLITPPVGMILFVLEGVAKGRATLNDIAIGALPFVGVMLASIALFYQVPELITWLPSVMMGN